jgi:hypothetical protein
VRHVVKLDLSLTHEAPVVNQSVDHGPSGQNVLDVRGLVEPADVMPPPAGDDLNATVPGLGVEIEQDPAWPQCAVKVSQSATDALTSYSSQGPRQDGDVVCLLR